MTSSPDHAGATADAPLSDAERQHLASSSIRTRADLEVAEEENIAAAREWAFGPDSALTPNRLLSVRCSDEIHRRMFGDVWTWAGRHCEGRTATGVEPHWIEHRLGVVFDDVGFWHRLGLGSPRERAARLRRRLADVQAYPVGSDAHARFMADLYLHLVGEVFIALDGAIRVVDPQPRPDLTALQQALDTATRVGELRRRFGLRG